MTVPGRDAGTAAIERGSGVAIWSQIRQALASAIESGELVPGARLPTEQELSARFGVNRHTVRRAIASLEENGLVRVDQGRGMFVAEQVVEYALGPHTRFSENILRQSRLPGARVIAAERLPAPAAVAEALRVRAGEATAMIRRLGHADGSPVSVSDHFFPLRRFPGIVAAVEAEQSISKALARLGVPDFVRRQTRVTTRMPDRVEAELLQQHRNRPILVTESINVDSDGVPVEYGLARFAGDRVQLVVET